MSPGDSTVLFRALRTTIKLTPSERRSIRSHAGRLVEEVAEGRPFSVLLTSDRELHDLNRQFLGSDYATDVLSFPALDGSAELGEIAISVERAAVQAQDWGHTRIEEIMLLMLHGVLHLTGLDHERDDGEMARAEKRWRLHFGLPTNLIARTGVALTV